MNGLQKKITEIRKQRGLSVEEVSKQAGFTPRTLYNIFDANTATFKQLEGIAKVLGVPVEVLIREEKEPAINPFSEENNALKKEIETAQNIIKMKDEFIALLQKTAERDEKQIEELKMKVSELSIQSTRQKYTTGVSYVAEP